MTKKEFILQAMLQLAGTGQYKDKYENRSDFGRPATRRFVTKEELILEDAIRLADCAEICLREGHPSHPSEVFEPDYESLEIAPPSSNRNDGDDSTRKD